MASQDIDDLKALIAKYSKTSSSPDEEEGDGSSNDSIATSADVQHEPTPGMSNHNEDSSAQALSNLKSAETNPSLAESALRGAAQGVTFGQAPKIAGAAAALPVAGQALMGNASLQDILDKYKTESAQSQGNFDAAAAANPKISLAGNLAGAALPGLLTGGIGGEAAAGSALVDAGTAAKAAQAARGMVPFVSKVAAKAAPIMESEAPEIGTAAQQLAQATAGVNKPGLSLADLVKQMQKAGRAENKIATGNANSQAMQALRNLASKGIKSKINSSGNNLLQSLKDTASANSIPQSEE